MMSTPQEKEKNSLLPRKTDQQTDKQIIESPDEKNTENPPRSLKYTAIGMGFLLLLISSYGTATIAAQMVGKKTSMFLLNTYRYTGQIVLAVIWLVATRYSIRMAKENVLQLVIATAMMYSRATLFYIASRYIPVGNLDGVYSGLALIISTTVDFFRKEIPKVSVINSGVAVIGITVLTQPWEVGAPSKLGNYDAPCDYIDHAWKSNIDNPYLDNGTNFIKSNVTDGDNIKNPRMNLVIGYSLIAIASVAGTVSGYVFKSLLRIYTVSCVFFWTGIIQLIFSIVFLLALKFAIQVSLSLPDGTACFGFAILFIVASTLTSAAQTSVFKFLAISTEAISKAFMVLILYAFQRTLLKSFHPGNQNFIEVIGIVLTALACLLSPVITIIYEKKRSDSDKDENRN